MQLGMIGLGRMGANMVRHLMQGGHQCAVWDQNPANVEKLAGEGATGALALHDLLKALQPPRAVWLMIPAAVVDGTLAELSARMESGDMAIEGNWTPRACITCMSAPAAACGDWSAACAR